MNNLSIKRRIWLVLGSCALQVQGAMAQLSDKDLISETEDAISRWMGIAQIIIGVGILIGTIYALYQFNDEQSDKKKVIGGLLAMYILGGIAYYVAGELA